MLVSSTTTLVALLKKKSCIIWQFAETWAVLEITKTSRTSSRSTFSQPFEEKCVSVVVRIGSIIILRLSKLWKAKFSILCDVIFLVRLQDWEMWNWSPLGVKEFLKKLGQHIHRGRSSFLWTNAHTMDTCWNKCCHYCWSGVSPDSPTLSLQIRSANGPNRGICFGKSSGCSDS